MDIHEAVRSKVPTMHDLTSLARTIKILNMNVRNLNRALFGETSRGSDDEFGEIGRTLAEAGGELEAVLNELIENFESRQNG